MPKNYYIIDFDSTFTQVEALDELARISLKKHPQKENIFKEIETLTNAAMEGRLSFGESLSGRIGLLQADEAHLQQLIKKLRKKVSSSFARNRAFFRSHAEEVMIVSGGFKEFIIPVVSHYHLKEENVFANTFKFDTNGKIIGCDTKNPLSKEGGKVKLLKQLNLKGDLYIIGDGFSDYQLKEAGIVKKFFAFTENIERETVIKKADHVTPSFDEFLYVNKLPMAISYPKNRIKVLKCGKIDAQAEAMLKKEGYPVTSAGNASAKPADWKEAGILLLNASQQLNNEQIEKADRLKVIGFFGNAKNNIDLETCTRKGIVVFDDPKFNPRNKEFIPKRVIDFINKGSTYLSVNFPNIELSRMEKAHRLIHIHENVPGIMARINSIFAKYNINIAGQYLKTNPAIGYVITDVEGEYDKKVIADLKKIKHTIKFRVLY